jgi:hypothetical protein
MTLKELVNGALETDLYEMLIWAKWYFGKSFSCKECIETRKMGSGKAPNCDLCGLPTAKLLKKHFKKETV